MFIHTIRSGVEVRPDERTVPRSSRDRPALAGRAELVCAYDDDDEDEDEDEDEEDDDEFDAPDPFGDDEEDDLGDEGDEEEEGDEGDDLDDDFIFEP